MLFSVDQLEKIRNLIYQHTGMLFEERKNYFLTSRLEERMRRTQSETFSEYFKLLILDHPEGELKQLIEAVTINETYFFRDFPQLQGFAENVLAPYLEKKAAARDFNLRIWSAACSTGEEAYTLSIILQEILVDRNRWHITIDASDIDTKVLSHAERGLYSERSLQDTPIEYRKKYFRQEGQDWYILPNARQLVRFQQLNLIDRQGMRAMRSYDFIFCRNVLIYFDDNSRRRVVSMLYDALLPHGYLFLGHSESLGRITASFEMQKLGSFLCHRKPA